MANEFRVNVYQINNRVLDRDQPLNMGFPTAGTYIQDCSTSPARSLSSGYNVYGVIVVPTGAAANSLGDRYYVAETVAQLITLLG